jgi:hypothetical protein
MYLINRNDKSQIINYKWFDRLTTLSRVEGQITMTKIQNSNFDGLVKIPNSRHSGERRSPEAIEITGFRRSPE